MDSWGLAVLWHFREQVWRIFKACESKYCLTFFFNYTLIDILKPEFLKYYRASVRKCAVVRIHCQQPGSCNIGSDYGKE